MTRNFFMMFCPNQFPHHISSRTEIKLQHKCNFNTTGLRNRYCWSSSIKWNLITYQVHWYKTATFSWLKVFLQLQEINQFKRNMLLAFQDIHYLNQLIYMLHDILRFQC
jgi:hypothetical protein